MNKGQVARRFQQVDKLPSREFRRDLGSAFPAQPRLSGANDGVCTVGYLQFRKDVGNVVAYGVGADKQACGDLCVAVTLGYEIEDLHLAGGELGEGLGRRGRFRCELIRIPPAPSLLAAVDR